MNDAESDQHAESTNHAESGASDRVAVDLGASAHLSFDTVDATDAAVHVESVGDDPVGVELAVDLGAVRTEVVLGSDATADLIADLRECHDALGE
jgi:hypothetical protein